MNPQHKKKPQTTNNGLTLFQIVDEKYSVKLGLFTKGNSKAPSAGNFSARNQHVLRIFSKVKREIRNFLQHLDFLHKNQRTTPERQELSLSKAKSHLHFSKLLIP